jgi:hypothetical protein
MTSSAQLLQELGRQIGIELAFDDGAAALAVDEALILTICEDPERNEWAVSAMVTDEGEIENIDPVRCLEINFALHANKRGSLALTHRFGPMVLADRFSLEGASPESLRARLEAFIDTWKWTMVNVMLPAEAAR